MPKNLQNWKEMVKNLTQKWVTAFLETILRHARRVLSLFFDVYYHYHYCFCYQGYPCSLSPPKYVRVFLKISAFDWMFFFQTLDKNHIDLNKNFLEVQSGPQWVIQICIWFLHLTSNSGYNYPTFPPFVTQWSRGFRLFKEKTTFIKKWLFFHCYVAD